MTTHHAVLFKVRNTEQFEVENFVSGENLLVHRHGTFGIGEVRALIQDAHRRPAGDNAEQVLVVIAKTITEEAQQALLKIVEEPPTSTRFVFVVPADVTLLPTLLSRFQEEKLSVRHDPNATFEDFLKSRLAKRMKLIEKNGKDHDWISDIKNGLVTYTGEQRRKLTAEQLSSLEYVASHLLTRGASNKFLLEHAALVLPT